MIILILVGAHAAGKLMLVSIDLRFSRWLGSIGTVALGTDIEWYGTTAGPFPAILLRGTLLVRVPSRT